MQDDSEIYKILAKKMGITAEEVAQAHLNKDWAEDIRERIYREKIRKRHGAKQGPSSPLPIPPLPPQRVPVTTMPVKPAPEPVAPMLMRATMRLHDSKFRKEYLPEEVIHAMMRNQIVPCVAKLMGKPPEIPVKMLDWCENNCSDLWMPSPAARPEYIMFASPVDMDLFLTVFGGG